MGGAPAVFLAALPGEMAALGPAARARARRAGVGAAAARRAVREAAATHPVGVVFFGFCGGLRADQRPGDLVICDRFLDAARDDPLPADPGLVCALRRAALRAAVVHETGASISVPGIVADPAAKAALARRGAAAVEMENRAAAEAAAEAGLPFAGLRAVVDTRDDDLRGLDPLFAAGLELELRGAVAHVLSHPRAAPALFALWGPSRRAARALGRVLEVLAADREAGAA